MPKHEVIHSIPPQLPCGCDSVIRSNRQSPAKLSDGSRICRTHDRRFRLVFEEVPFYERPEPPKLDS